MADQSDQLRRILDEAFRAFESGQDERARQLCREALAIDPESSTAHSLMGLLYEREGRMSDASEEFRAVVARNPESEADRTTLRRLRGRPLPAGLGDDGDSARRRHLVAGVAAVAVALVVFLGGSFAVLRQTRGDGERTAAATTSVEEDLALAREAFQQGRYDVALDAARRVLRAQPDNATAREIYDKALAYLQGTQSPPAPGTGGFAPRTPRQAPQPQSIETRPAVPATPHGFAAVPQAGGQAPAASAGTRPAGGAVARSSLGNLAPVLPAVPDYTRPGTPYGGATLHTRPAARSNAPAWDITAATRDRTYVRRPLGRPDIEPIDQPDRGQRTPSGATTVGGAGPAAETKPDDSYLHVEVRQREPVKPGSPAPEAKPDLDGSAPALDDKDKKDDDKPASPEVQERQDKQERLRAHRQRQQAAESRRADTQH